MNSPSPLPSVEREVGGRRRLLLVEDEPSLCQFLGELLGTEYRVETALDGEQAWDAIQQERPDMVLSNADMPVLDGIELVRRLRASPATSALPVLLLTARVDHDTLEQGLAVGVNGLMQKPFRPRELLAALRRLG